MQKLQIRLSSFKQVSITCEYERSHLCYIIKTFKDVNVAKIAKSDFQALKVSRLREVQRSQRFKDILMHSYSQICILLKQIDQNLVELIWTTKNCEISSISGLVTKLSNQ